MLDSLPSENYFGEGRCACCPSMRYGQTFDALRDMFYLLISSDGEATRAPSFAGATTLRQRLGAHQVAATAIGTPSTKSVERDSAHINFD